MAADAPAPATPRRAPATAAWRFALLTLRREWRAGELVVLLAAIVVAVAAMTAVGYFTQRVSRAMDLQGAELLAADLVLRSGRPIADALLDDAAERGLERTRKISLASVVLAGDASSLADIDAVAPGYPLRGRVRVADALLREAAPVREIPARGEAWLDPSLCARLGIDVGATITVGELELRVTRVLVGQPDRGFGFADLAPPLLMHYDDVPATGLVQPGSRVAYYALFAGAPGDVTSFRETLAAGLSSAEELRDLESARPELRSAVARARQFLGLAALCSALVAGTAIALAARRYASRRIDTIALLKCLGASRARVRAVLAFQVAALMLAGGIAGTAVGYGAQAAIALLLTGAFSAPLPAANPLPGAASGLAVAAVLLLGFALPPLLALAHVPPARVLRRELSGPTVGMLLWQASALAAFIVLLGWIARDVRIATYALVGAAVTCGLLAACGVLLVRGLQRVRDAGGAAWRYGLASIARRRGDSVLQLAAFGLGLMLMLLIALARGQLLDGWRTRLPPDAPNQFLINIQPDEREAVSALLRERTGAAPEMVPLVRARVTHVDGEPVGERATGERGERFVQRESNLTWTDRLSDSNEIVAGEWWTGVPATPEVSVEEEFAQSLGIGLGDELTFDIAGERLAASVTSVRSVDWESFEPNFFMVLSPGAIEDYPGTYITSLYVPPGETDAIIELVRRFPSVTPIDMNAVFAQVRGIMDRAVLAVECVFLFALAAGITVLVAAVQATSDERRRETALLRVFGARRATIVRALALEFGTLGLLAGLLAMAGAAGVAYGLALQVFELPFAPQPLLWLLGPLAGLVVVGAAGVLATRGVLAQPPMQTLRRP
jgi:putative ABC transport system permease protein